MLGIALQSAWSWSLGSLIVVAAGAVGTAAVTGRWARASTFALCGAIVAVGAGLLAAREALPRDHLGRVLPPGPIEVVLRGTVATGPVDGVTAHGSPWSTFTLAAREVWATGGWRGVSGRVAVIVTGTAASGVDAGATVEGVGLLAPTVGARNPGGWDEATALGAQGVRHILRVGSRGMLRVQAAAPWWSPLPAAARLRHHLHERLGRSVRPPAGAFLQAVLLGDRQVLAPDLVDALLATGTIHILAISGLNVGVLAAILLGGLAVCRVPRRVAWLCTCGGLVFYAGLTGGSPPVARATIMAVVYLVGRVCSEETTLLNSLALAAMLMVVAEPRQIFTASFQLSFLAVLALDQAVPRVLSLVRRAGGPGGAPPARGWLARTRAGVGGLAWASATVWLVLAPVIAAHFHIVTPAAVLANPLVIPLFSVVLTLGVITAVAACVWPAAGDVFGGSAWLAVTVLQGVVRGLARLPGGAWVTGQVSGLTLVLAAVGLGFVGVARQRREALVRAVLVGLVLVNQVVWPLILRPREPVLRVTLLDVGHGDAAYVEFPYGGNMLVDGGTADAGRRVVVPFLRAQGVRALDSVVLTHADADHVGGLIPVLAQIRVRHVVDNGLEAESQSYQAYRRAVVARRVPRREIRAGQAIHGYRSVEVAVLHPPTPLLAGTGADENNNSLVLRLQYGMTSLLLMGDVEEDGVQALLADPASVRATVVKMPHHGGEIGDHAELLLAAARPAAAVVSVGDRSLYGLPAVRTLRALAQSRVPTYLTVRDGAVLVALDGRRARIWTRVGAGTEAQWSRGVLE